jgi:hypothetical protein
MSSTRASATDESLPRLARRRPRRPHRRRPGGYANMRPGRDVLQSRVKMSGENYLVRLIVDIDKSRPEVVTVYRTSKLSKYWRQP